MYRRLDEEDFVTVNEEIVRLSGYEASEQPEHSWYICSGYSVENGRIVPRYGFDREHFSEWRGYDPLLDTPGLFLQFARLRDQELSEELILEWVHEYGLLGLGPLWRKDAIDSEPLAGIQNPLDKPAVYHAVSVLLDSGSTVMGHTDPLDGFRDEAIIAAAALKMYEAALCGRKKEARELVFFEFPFMELMHGFSQPWWEPVARRYFGEHLTKDLQMAILGGVRQTNDFARQNQEATTDFIMHFVSKFDLDPLEHAFSLSAMIAEQRVQALCYPKTVLAAPEGEYSPTNLQSGWGYRNLLGAMYLQMHWLITSGGDVVRCKHCGRIISLAKAPIPGARKPPRHKRFCNEYCRYNHHYQVKKKPAREGASPP